MTTSNSKPTKVLLATFITLFLLLLNNVNSSDDLSFNFNKFVPNETDVLFQGDASVSSTGVLQVTKVENGKPKPYSVGRARYAAPVHIWENTTGRVASFSTSFSFVVKAPGATETSDGLAFFLAPPDSQIPSGRVSKYLGLFDNPNYNSSNQIVAVEFDTYFGHYYDPWDPSYQHIGIDVNSINSTKTARWDWRNGEVATATITYLAPTKTLTASLIYPSDQTNSIVTASVDLKAILPEWVRVGFSAATGSSVALETHDVLSWSFTSTFKANGDAAMENIVHIARYTA
uniref:Lectin n=1 Tax=Sophora flavescens TaxID=49840 RepID=A0A2H4X1V8_SOPFL|nr:lectin [Sophora flavescens]